MSRSLEMPSSLHALAAEPARHRSASESFDLTGCLAEIEAVVPPLWPLKDYVAVNPFLGLSHRTFLAAYGRLRQVRDCEMLPSAEYFRTRLEEGKVTEGDIKDALRQCAQQYPELYAGLDAARVVQQVTGKVSAHSSTEGRCYTFSEFLDHRLHSRWTGHIVNDISRHCSAYYDDGQASWPYPWKHLSLYQAWRESAQVSRRMGYLGMGPLRQTVGKLPLNPRDAIAWLVEQLNVPSHRCSDFLQSELYSVAGWGSFVKHRSAEEGKRGRINDDLLGLLAVRLAYDLTLLQSQQPSVVHDYRESLRAMSAKRAVEFPVEVLARYAMQVAAEIAYRRQLMDQLRSLSPARPAMDRKTLQAVFCIDVRSEVMRRHLESLSPSIETFGFAGFFGMALEYVPLGMSAGIAQYPVLLTPAIRVEERPLDCDDHTALQIVEARGLRRTLRKIWKAFQTSAVSCFSFVESQGLLYFGKLLTDSLRLTRPVASAAGDGIPRRSSVILGPELHAKADGLTLARKADLAEGMLRNLGVTEGFARIVVICGHAAEVTNNPYKAGLDCGACGGHSGEPNARVAAALLNDSEVRGLLRQRGISIPSDTWFVPAVHNTTTDELRLLDTKALPATHANDFEQVRTWVCEAGARCRQERCGRLGAATTRDVLRRSRDWSEVRPEWGLAGNAAFIIAPRARTRSIDLAGRAFMHSYDAAKDPEFKVLELIMTAPMIVTSWINLQYYASSVDNRSFGSGSKTIHNVVGQFGVLAGNGGDLQTGLPWQSVHDGVKLQHEPLRLLVLIEAPREAVQRVIEKHSMVRDLASNGWLSVMVWEDEQFFRWAGAEGWAVEPSSTQRVTLCHGSENAVL